LFRGQAVREAELALVLDEVGLGALDRRPRPLHRRLVVGALEPGEDIAFPDAAALLDPEPGQPALDLAGDHGLAAGLPGPPRGADRGAGPGPGRALAPGESGP